MITKTKHQAAFALSLLIAGSSALTAQTAGDTFSYFYGSENPGASTAAGGGHDQTFTLGSTGYDSWQHVYNSGVRRDIEVQAATSPDFFGTGRIDHVFKLGSFGEHQSLPADLTEVVTGITLHFYADGLQPNPGTTTFYYYDSTGSTTPLGSFDVTSPSVAGTFISLGLPASLLGGEFVIGLHENFTQQPTLNLASEIHSNINFRPGFSVTTELVPVVIPEPSSLLLLSSLGAFALFRRQRA